jgi:4-hydroxy-3-methylbut-2-en-1-yl diphosphate reductase
MIFTPKCKICYSLAMKNRFKVIDVYPRGFCKGVFNAIELAKKARVDHPDEKISILGELVHNKEVSKALKSLHIDTIETKNKRRIDLLDEVDSGLVIFSAHGISPVVIEKARTKGLGTINASCEDVLVTQDQIKAYLKENYDVLYVGQKGHPEAEAVLDLDLTRIRLVEIGQMIPTLTSDKMFVTNQTTMSIFDIKETLSKIQEKYPHAIISDETCSATRLRQEAILKLPQTVDGIIIIGDKSSNNTKMLAKIAANKSIQTIIPIQNLRELDASLLNECKEVAITAGASTPKFIIDEVVNFVKAYAIDDTVSKEAYSINPFI